jgi:hypothetical protein
MEDLTSGLHAEFLKPKGRFDKGHGHGTFFFIAPPAAVFDVFIKQLGTGAWLKQSESLHIIVVPRVITSRWRKHLTGGLDFNFHVDLDKVSPLKEHFKPLLLFVCFPSSSNAPRLSTDKGLLLEELQGALLQNELPEIPEVQ